MYTTALPQRPRPPGARRGPLRATAGEAPPLPSKHSLRMQESPTVGKGAGYDMYTSPVQRSGVRRRPLSLLSEASVLSPPPPYGRGLAPSPDDKTPPMAIPPPPPEILESGPSSVRNSLIDNDVPGPEGDDSEPWNTLTLRGVQKLIRQHEFAMSDTLQGQLLELTSSPNATLPSQFDLDEGVSPHRSSPYRLSPHGRRLRTVPSDPGLAFSHPRSRVTSHTDARDLRLAAIRAEEDASTIAQLEDALAEARDGEEAQRKAVARLRRDLLRMKRELEHAEEAIIDNQHYASPSDADRDRLRSVESFTQLGSEPKPRARGSYGPPPDDEPVVWGATAFPEFPRYGDMTSDVETEVADEPTSSEDVSTSSSITTEESTVKETSAPQEPSSAASPSSDVRSDTPASPVVVLERAARPRPLITASTFASPPRDSISTPQLSINPASLPSSAQRTPVGTGPRRSRSVRTGGTGSNLLRESMRVRTRSFNSGAQYVSTPGHSRKSSDVDWAAEPSPCPSSASYSSDLSIIDSVRSIYSAVVGVHRSLGSELGSGFHPTPTRTNEDMAGPPTDLSAPVTPLNMIQRGRHARYPSNPTAMFHFRGTLESPSQLGAYDSEYPDAPIRRGPVAENWTPQPWPTPCPPPRDGSSEIGSSDMDYTEVLQIPKLLTPEPLHARRGWPSQPGAGAGLTPSPRYTTGLAPCTDPWDEYSDRLTPSPRMRNLRPLLLLTRPATHARTSSLALAKDRSASRAGFKFGRVPPQPVPEPTPSNIVVAYTRGARHVSPAAKTPIVRLPVTIPGRITHDLFCLILVLLDYLEWFIILLYRFTVDFRAGPAGAESALGFKRRQHPRRFYL